MDENQPNNNHRRDFFKKMLLFTGAGVLAQTLGRTHAFAADLLPIDMSGKKRTDADNKACVGVATGLGYTDNLDSSLKAKKIVKADKPGFKANEQICSKCMFYNYKKETPEKPTCQLIAQCLVNPKGSCNSWAPKA